MRPFIFLVVATYAGVALLLTVGEAVKKKSVRFTKPELRTIRNQTVLYATVMLVMTYVYYFLGIKTE